jgi:predicted GNAT family acetyltransferase
MGQIRQNATLNRFEFDVAGGTAVAFYRLADGVVSITHTEVPFALRGQGIGSQMMHGVLQNVREQGLRVVPRCSFAADFIQRHPHYADLAA